jgi:hypothetical protein
MNPWRRHPFLPVCPDSIIHISEAQMTKIKNINKTPRKVVPKELTFLDVRKAARGGQKVFDKFVITGKLPIK